MPSAVRAYDPRYRAELGDVSHRVGFMGGSADDFWPHRESAFSIWLAPYLDNEPGSTFVATIDGEIVGYLTGCLDTQAFAGPDTVMTSEMRKYRLLYRGPVAQFLRRAMRDIILDRLRRRRAVSGEIHDARWPSHLHINLVAEARGRGLGGGLMEAWFDRMRKGGIAGLPSRCHH